MNEQTQIQTNQEQQAKPGAGDQPEEQQQTDDRGGDASTRPVTQLASSVDPDRDGIGPHEDENPGEGSVQDRDEFPPRRSRQLAPPEAENENRDAGNTKEVDFYPPRRSRRLAPPDQEDEGPAGSELQEVLPPRRRRPVGPVPGDQADEDEPELPEDGPPDDPVPNREQEDAVQGPDPGARIRQRLQWMAQGQVYVRPRDETPERVRRLFGRLRRFRQLSPTEKLVQTVLSGRNPCGLEKPRVFEICEVLHQALLVCKADRQEACVLSALELRAREGKRLHDASDVTEVTGQRTSVVRVYLEALRGRGIVAEISGWQVRYELTRPLFKLLDAPVAEDPIDVLRREPEELNELDDGVVYTLALKAAERAAEDRLAKEEAETLSRIADEGHLLAQLEQAYRALAEQVNARRESIVALKRTLSKLRWSKRFPFDVQEQLEEDYPRARRVFPPWM